MRSTKTIKVLEFHQRIMKIMEILEFHKRIKKNIKTILIPNENHENPENLRITYES